ncbi:UDP-glucose/GDP-mannose dehydrogenase family protein [Lentzea sp. HUAS12]|uniref:UDP-glucose dehydrogenase family protein n=1 Tax=Lentzea sp. HUAS12 TaxID=2951806 RepID=UPI00209FC286|nr:UDP-glucose/GDP-mannose dehydrogenase family protein [Lentzea sp. HUAS12]USX53396.1 UDP-glucose/GDP-mannose dehydrogenase family protein [Lentzea sp. HUAS12]
MHDIAVFGAGYIGLVTGACLAQLGHRVTVRDIRPDRVDALRRGEVPIHEPGLGDLIAGNAERLRFTLDAEEALRTAEVAFVCVDTPPSASGDADLSRVWSVVEDLRGAPRLTTVVMKSTVPVGTGDRVRVALDAAGMGHVGYASNPEFTAEGTAVRDFLNPDRIVVGAADQEVAALVARLHRGIDAPVQEVSVASAEMAKMAANALLATKITFINEIAAVCEATGADVEEVAAVVGRDHRLGPHFLKAGLGYGGSCFPKDSRALRAIASNCGLPLPLLGAVIEVNDLQARRAVARVRSELGGLRGRQVALLGLTFKPGTDDMRQAPSAVIAARLLSEGAVVTAWDPMAPELTDTPWNQVERKDDVLAAVADCDAAVIVTEWPELHDVDWGKAAEVMSTPLLFDGRNLLDPADQAGHGFTYMSVGRATARQC